MILRKRERSKIISKINSIVIRETSAAVLLVIATDNNLKFGKHIEIFAVKQISNYTLKVELENLYSQEKLGYYAMLSLIDSLDMH